MWTALVVLSLGAAPVKLAAAGFTQLNLTDAAAEFYSQHFAQQLSQQAGLQVVTSQDIANALGLERQRQLLGCSESSSSCMAELAGALGVEGIVSGQVAKIGNAYQVNVKIMGADGVRALFLFSNKVLNEEGVLDSLNAAARNAGRLLSREATSDAPMVRQREEPRDTGGVRWGPFAVMGAGGVTAVVGLAFIGDAASRYGQLDTAGQHGGQVKEGVALTPEQAVALRDGGKMSQVVGWSLLGAGVAAAGAGLLWWRLGGDSEVQASAWSSGTGAGVVVRGVLP